MTQQALEQARTLLNELTEAARNGQIIPVRLTGQLQAISDLLTQAAEPEAQTAPEEPTGDLETYRHTLAEFLRHAFHDLRLPLTSIRGYSDMLGNPAMGQLTPMQQQFVDVIKANSRRLESLLVDVSDMSKIRGGVLNLTPKMDMFKNIAMMVEKQMRPLADELKRTLTLEIPSGLPILNIDGDMLAKALNKLVENALRYNQPENGIVVLRAAAENGYLLIFVEDNGIGMSPEQVARLGEPYFRSDDERVLAFKGSGLGTPVAFGIIALLGGTISVDSQPEQGTTITVILPGMT
jgi:cell cycle sensor histidine kinase DivJ